MPTTTTPCMVKLACTGAPAVSRGACRPCYYRLKRAGRLDELLSPHHKARSKMAKHCKTTLLALSNASGAVGLQTSVGNARVAVAFVGVYNEQQLQDVARTAARLLASAVKRARRKILAGELSFNERDDDD